MGCSSSAPAESDQQVAPGPTGQPPPPYQQQQPQHAPTKKPAAAKEQQRTASQVKVDARLALIQPNDAIGRLLKTVPLLSKLSDTERAKLGGAVSEKNYQDGQKIITQGEPGTGFFIIRKGAVSVSRTDEHGRKQELATLKVTRTSQEFTSSHRSACATIAHGCGCPSLCDGVCLLVSACARVHHRPIAVPPPPARVSACFTTTGW
jgi:hypothetical protein